MSQETLQSFPQPTVKKSEHHPALRYMLSLMLVAIVSCTPDSQEATDTKLAPTPSEPPTALTTPEAEAASESGERNPLRVVEYDAADPEFVNVHEPAIRFVPDPNGESGVVRLQTSAEVVGTCAVTYLVVDETPAEIDISRRWGEQDCQVNRDVFTALQIKTDEWQSATFRPEGEVVTIYFLVRTDGDWENATITDITADILGQ